MLSAASSRTIILSVSPSLDSSISVPSSPATTPKPADSEVLRKLNEHLMKNLSPTLQFINHPIKFEGKIPIIKKSSSSENLNQAMEYQFNPQQQTISSPPSALCVNFNTTSPTSAGPAASAAAVFNNSSQHNGLNTTIVYKAIGGGTTTLSPIPVAMSTTPNNTITTTDGAALHIKSEVFDSDGSGDASSELMNSNASQNGGTGVASGKQLVLSVPYNLMILFIDLFNFLC